MPTSAGDGSSTAGRTLPIRGKLHDLALSALWRPYGRSAEIHRRGTLAVQLFRFVVTPTPAKAPRRAHNTPSHQCAPSLATALPAGLPACSRPAIRSTQLHSECYTGAV